MAKLDENLYSRQLYAIGLEAMASVIKTSVLISNLNGLGVEIAKNTILSGFKSVTLHDINNTDKSDLNSNYYLSESDIGQNRAKSVHKKLAELNNYVAVNISTDKLTQDLILAHAIIILVDYPISKQIKINNFTHENNIKFISVSTKGYFGQIFCDFNSNFLVSDQDGEPLNTGLITNITQEKTPVITCADTKFHNLTTGDRIKLSNIQGMVEFIPELEIQYLDKLNFRINLDTTNFTKYQSGGEFTQIKIPKKLNFKNLSESIKKPEFVPTDFSDPYKIHLLFQEYNNYITYENYYNNIKIYNTSPPEDLIKKFYYNSNLKFGPINSVIGGITSQEILKSASGKYSPIFQWLYYDCSDMDITPEIQTKINKSKIFIAGSGAIGCELLKNFALINLASEPPGKIHITDMDFVEKSNLNRQFLFRNSDIGKSKSLIAAQSIKLINPKINIIPQINKLGPESENHYNMDFYKNIDICVNALDNINTRLYMDSRCVLFKKPLFESGTLGTKGNTQVIIPYLTESYSASRDPPENSVPICTIKTFPNSIEHVIQYARELFEDLIYIKPKNMVEYLNNISDINNYINKLAPGDAINFLDNIKFMVNNIPNKFSDCVRFVYNQFYSEYNHQIQILLNKFPLDYKTENNLLFWSGARRCPHVLNFDPADELTLNYIYTISNIWANIFNIKPNIHKKSDYLKILLNLNPPDFLDKNIPVSESDEKIRVENLIKSTNILDLINSLPKISNPNKIKITPQEFDKDSETNYHIDFIYCVANLRALNYNIKPVDKLTAKGIAGKIIPALATTTSVIAGLVTIEIIKYISNITNLEKYKNSYINLALPYFGSSEPIQIKKNKINNFEFSIWDIFIIDHDIKLSELLTKFKKDYNLELETITYNNFMVYGVLIKINPTKLAERLDQTIKNILEKNLENNFDNIKSINLQICLDSEEDINLPEILYIF